MMQAWWVGMAVGAALAAVLPSAVQAERIQLKDGSSFSGRVVGRSESEVRIALDGGGAVTVAPGQIERVVADAGAGAAPPGGARLRFAGSNTIGERLVPDLAEAWSRQAGGKDAAWQPGASEVERMLVVEQPGPGMPAEVDVKAHGSTTSFVALDEGVADIGMASRRIKDEEINRLRRLDPSLPDETSEHVLALDGLAVIVHPGNPVAALTPTQIADLFEGKISNWSAVGGPDEAVNVYRRDDKSGTYDTFQSLVMQKRSIRGDATAFESSEALADAVADDPGGIGFIGLAYVRDAKALGIRECSMIYDPTLFSVKTEEYPLFRRLYLYTPAALRTEQVQSFVRFALSDDAHPIVNDAGFVNLEVSPGDDPLVARTALSRARAAIAEQQDAEVMRAFAGATDGATRLSATFRFETGSSKLDSRAQRDIGRLATAVQALRIDAKRLALFGFADTNGDYQSNLRLSDARAQAVAAALRSAGVDVGLVKGFGEEAPVACNEGAGLARNRHVEVWLR
jgi:phosphate transport system substrate-binding protein